MPIILVLKDAIDEPRALEGWRMELLSPNDLQMNYMIY